MEFNSTSELLKSDPQAQAYFDTLPSSVQQQLLDKYTGAKCLDELRSFGDDLLTDILKKWCSSIRTAPFFHFSPLPISWYQSQSSFPHLSELQAF